MDIGVIITRLNRELAIANTMGSDAAEHRRLRIEPLESSLGAETDHLPGSDFGAQVDGEQVAIPQSNASLQTGCWLWRRASIKLPILNVSELFHSNV